MVAKLCFDRAVNFTDSFVKNNLIKLRHHHARPKRAEISTLLA